MTDAAVPAIDAPAPDAAILAALTVTPLEQDFGSVTFGAMSLPVTFTVSNTGTEASGPIVATVVGATDYPVVGDTCSGQALSGGQSCTVTVMFQPTGSTPGPKATTLSVAATPGGAPTSSLSGTAITAGQLKIAPAQKDFGPVTRGSTSGATSFTVTNSGQSATGIPTVLLSDTVSFAIASNDCTAPLAAGATCAVAVQFKPTAVGARQSRSITVSADPGGSAAASVSGTGTARVAVTSVGGGTVTSSPPGVNCGATCVATFTDSPVQLTATPDAGHVFVSWSGACSGAGSCSVALGSATNSVTATFASVPLADIRVTGTDAPDPVVDGQPVTYTLTVRNFGPDAASAVVLADTLPSGLSFVSGSAGCTATASVVTCAVGNLGNGASAAVIIQARPSAAGTLTSSVAVTATEVDPDSSNNSISVSTTVTPVVDLALASITATPNPAVSDSNETYTIVVHNGGLDTAIGVMLTDVLGTDTSSTTATPSQGSCARTDRTVSCSLGSIPGGGNATVTVVAFNFATGTLTNSATVTSSSPDRNPNDNAKTVTTPVDADVKVMVVGSGRVDSTPAGISNCTASCTARFATDTIIQLTVTPALGFRFAGWGGFPCGGDPQSDFERTCEFNLGGSYTATATFVPITNNIVFFFGTHPANLGGTAPYDSRCNQAATDVGLNNATNNAYIAWMSDGNSRAIDRLGAARGFIRPDGAPVADDLSSLLQSGAILNSISMNNIGGRDGRESAWTGTLPDGSVGFTCNNWTSTSGMVTSGNVDDGPARWTNNGASSCSDQISLYCFMKTRTNPLSYVHTPGKRIYVAASTPGGGIAAANAACDAGKPSDAGPVAALMPAFGPPARSASTLLAPDTTYVRPDGVVIGTGTDIVNGFFSTTGPWQYGDGTYGTDLDHAFTGTSRPADVPTSASDTCNDWTSVAATSVCVGHPVESDFQDWWLCYGGKTCQNVSRIYCVEL